MKINGEKLAWALIHFSFFLAFVFVDFDIKVDETTLFFEALFILSVYLGFWLFFGWRFIENMKESFK